MKQENTSTNKWAWLKKYKGWETNRKVFLYPENWLDPEFRDDKSSFFEEIDDEILSKLAAGLFHHPSALKPAEKMKFPHFLTIF
jgi:hypothetical protein